MFSRQLWRTQKPCTVLSTTLPCSLHSEIQFLCNYRNGQRDISTTLCRKKCLLPASADYSTNLPPNSGKISKQEQKRSFQTQSNSKFVEPLINPESLSDSLHAHQKANREGTARDGIPVKRSKKRRTSSQNRPPLPDPQTSTSVLHLPIEHTSKIVYGGRCPPLLSEWRPAKTLPFELRYPWTLKQDKVEVAGDSMLAMQVLETEIRACEKYFSPYPSERVAATQAFDDIANCIQSGLGSDVVVTLIGSRAAGTESPTSDLDINISLPEANTDTDRSRSVRSKLSALEKSMRWGQFKDTILFHIHIRKAHVPIIVGTHVPSGLEFQIQSTTSSYDSLEVSKAFVAEYPTARVLFKMIKQLLSMRGLNRGNFGGVTSYPLLNMIVTSLKLGGTQHSANDSLVASQLLAFLDFWSEFNFDKDKIAFVSLDRAIDPISSIPQILPKYGKMTPGATTMSLQDPSDPMNDLGKNTYSINHIQACFIEARSRLQHALNGWAKATSDDIHQSGANSQRQPLLSWCLGGDYTSFEEARVQLQKYGRQEINKTTQDA